MQNFDNKISHNKVTNLFFLYLYYWISRLFLSPVCPSCNKQLKKETINLNIRTIFFVKIISEIRDFILLWISDGWIFWRSKINWHIPKFCILLSTHHFMNAIKRSTCKIRTQMHQYQLTVIFIWLIVGINKKMISRELQNSK